jgi:hypothetical protein
MAREVLVGVLVVLILSIIAAIALFVLGSGLAVRDNVLNTSLEMRLGKNELFAGNFQLQDVRYFNRSISEDNSSFDVCQTGTEIAIMRIIFDQDKLPDMCEISIDRRIIERIAPADYRCRDYCPGTETSVIVDLEAQDVTRSHEVELCCDRLCLSDTLGQICKG